MDAVKFLEERARMCGKLHCYECPLYRHNKQDNTMECNILSADNVAQSVAVVEKWAEEHPRKTLLSELLKRWPAVKRDHNGIPLIYPCIANTIQYKLPFGGCEKRGVYCEECRKEYWLQEVE